MDERMQVWAGSVLLVVGAVIVLLLALPSLITVPVVLGALAALTMAAGTLLVGVSSEGV